MPVTLVPTNNTITVFSVPITEMFLVILGLNQIVLKGSRFRRTQNLGDGARLKWTLPIPVPLGILEVNSSLD